MADKKQEENTEVPMEEDSPQSDEPDESEEAEVAGKKKQKKEKKGRGFFGRKKKTDESDKQKDTDKAKQSDKQKQKEQKEASKEPNKRKTPPSNQYNPDEMEQQTPGEEAHGQNYGQGAGMRSQGQTGYQPPKQGMQGGGSGRQDQMQGLIFREAQASKQMVYEVYGNCITMLEEMENRELKKSGNEALPRSDIYLPDQSKFDDDTVQRKLDTQLILLQAQLTSCHDAIKDEVKDELKENTLNWSSEREERQVPNGLTDKYAQKLFGLLETGKTEHPKEFSEPPTIDEEGMQKALGAIVQGNQKRADLDQEFRDDRDKKATGPKLRKTAGIDKGADRIVQGNPEHEQAVNSYRTNLR